MSLETGAVGGHDEAITKESKCVTVETIMKFVGEKGHEFNDLDFDGEEELVIERCDNCEFRMNKCYDEALIADSQNCNIFVANQLKKINIVNCSQIHIDFDAVELENFTQQLKKVSMEYADAQVLLDTKNNLIKQLELKQTELVSDNIYKKEQLETSERMVLHLLDEKEKARNTNTSLQSNEAGMDRYGVKQDGNGQISTPNAIQSSNSGL